MSEAHPLLSRSVRSAYLSAEEESELVERMRRGDQRALSRLVLAHMRLVASVTGRYSRCGVARADLTSEGVLGLVEAARRFDPERGNRFGVYARWWVRAFVRRYAMANRRIVPAPSTRNGRRILWSLSSARNSIAQREGRPATREELAAELGVTVDEVAMVEGALSGRDVTIGTAPGERDVDPPAHAPSPEELTAAREERRLDAERVASAVRSLPERERVIIRQRYLEPERRTLAELGDHLGLSRERVRQIEKKAHDRLRVKLATAS